MSDGYSIIYPQLVANFAFGSQVNLCSGCGTGLQSIHLAYQRGIYNVMPFLSIQCPYYSGDGKRILSHRTHCFPPNNYTSSSQVNFHTANNDYYWKNSEGSCYLSGCGWSHWLDPTIYDTLFWQMIPSLTYSSVNDNFHLGRWTRVQSRSTPCVYYTWRVVLLHIQTFSHTGDEKHQIMYIPRCFRRLCRNSSCYCGGCVLRFWVHLTTLSHRTILPDTSQLLHK